MPLFYRPYDATQKDICKHIFLHNHHFVSSFFGYSLDLHYLCTRIHENALG